MTIQTSPGLAEQFIATQLLGDGTLTAMLGTNSGMLTGPSVFARIIPEGALYPAIVYQLYSSVDGIGSGFSYYLTTSMYVVRAADRVGSIAGLDAIMYRVRQLLHGQANVILAGGAMLACQRERNLTEPDLPVAGVQTRTLAALYRVVTQEVYP